MPIQSCVPVLVSVVGTNTPKDLVCEYSEVLKVKLLGPPHIE